MLRRTGDDASSTDAGITVKLSPPAVNGAAIGDTMFTSEIVRALGDRAGFDTSFGITPSGTNGLPFDWDTGQGSAADAIGYIANLDGWRWLVHAAQEAGFLGGLRYGPFGDAYLEPSREWTASLEREATEDLEDVELANEVVQPFMRVPGIADAVILHADPDPLAYTALTSPNGVAIVNQVRLADLQDQQPDAVLATTVAKNQLARVSVRRVRGPLKVYELIGATGPVSHLELRAGDRLGLRDYETSTGEHVGAQDVVYVNQFEDHAEPTVTDDVSPEALLARMAMAIARRT